MFFRSLIAIIVSCLLSIASLLGTPAALAVSNIKLYDLSYHECPPELAEGNVTSGGSSAPASCYIIAGKAENKSGKTVYDADVFGRIYDANNEPMMQNRGRVGNIPEVPIGVSDFEIRITVPANQPTPLKLEQFKASGFAGAVRW
jgi:hypothetical protein